MKPLIAAKDRGSIARGIVQRSLYPRVRVAADYCRMLKNLFIDMRIVWRNTLPDISSVPRKRAYGDELIRVLSDADCQRLCV